ncbi:dethiobiotin synthase [Citricoccus sp. SGAir0253]|uniref:dethiobiotin synthase n=1 Tax=Citricoccus sp. SGAir0253 TaxID=2567881 RepID=UPI0010CD0B63|nr:dethiobiotin synthase [Citricoccus sp. SGAir0253]QCU76924.1 dethiobiotin synthase [Citricoccus sp. SGAir0253]
MSAAVLCVTGTDTDVGKTIATACLAAAALAAGERVAVYKPAQTGVGPDEPGDVDTVAALLGRPGRLTVAEGVRVGPAMAPVDAALEAGGEAAAAALPDLRRHLDRIADLAAAHDTVLVEGAGGLLVQLTPAGDTIADVALACEAPLAVVARPDLGTLNHTGLTLEAAGRRGVRPGPLVVGSWPAEPSAVHRANLVRLQELAAEHGYAFGGTLPAGLGAAEAAEVFRVAGGLVASGRGR